MEFDKTRVYTAVNADELKVDSLIITAENLAQLEHKVELNIGIKTLIEIADKDYSDRFGIDINDGVEDIVETWIKDHPRKIQGEKYVQR